MSSKLGLIILCIVSFVFSSAFFVVHAQSNSSLNSYSLSFAKINNWWPTADNSFQQIDAALWKDNDNDTVKQFTNLNAQWKFDPEFYEINNTQSNFQQNCPIEKVGTNRSCIVFTAHVKTLKPGTTDVQLTLKDNQGGTVWNAEPAVIYGSVTPNIIPSGLSQYSLSFESDPVRKFWPTPQNHFQGVAVALWKDNDGDKVKRFTNLQAEWQFDPYYFSVANTSSQYFDKCPVTVVNNRPCIYFYASVTTNNPGNTSVKLNVRDENEEAWNAYPVIVEDISGKPIPNITVLPTIISIAGDSDYKDLQQRVKMLEKKTQEQEVQLQKTQGLLDRIVAFLGRIFRFQ